RWHGVDIIAQVRSPRVAELARLMPEKLPPDTSKMLLCPMPGVITSISVAEGDEVEAGQALATVEAMKMENILRAERKGRVARVSVKAGDSLAVDEVILQFD
ncbi:biotin/lipoyl-containing protein, partial [Agrobacterium cavarae]|uniref:biotin/lipoyl-containing protein n=1 Tax=Agrobacterium cavarae TaxID=2528239 RepID=UPI0028A8C571